MEITMHLFEKLITNKGTVSSALGKELAKEVLDGNEQYLKEAVELVNYDIQNIKSKGVRAGAAKILEKVAEKKPELVAPYLKDIHTALEVKEPQTRWMIMQTYRFCTHLNPEVTSLGIQYAKSFINEHQGVCLSGASELFLGSIGSISKDKAEEVFPILLQALNNALLNEIDWILEAFYSIYDNLNAENQAIIIKCSKKHLNSSKKSTVKRVEKILKKAG